MNITKKYKLEVSSIHAASSGEGREMSEGGGNSTCQPF